MVSGDDNRIALELRPGIVGLHVGASSSDYPPLTDDFAAILRDLGCEVRFAEPADERRTSQLRAGEVWIPVLQVAETIGLGAVGSIVAEAIIRLVDRLRRRDQARTAEGDIDVHVLIHRGADGSEIHSVELHGDASKVVESLRALAD